MTEQQIRDEIKSCKDSRRRILSKMAGMSDGDKAMANSTLKFLSDKIKELEFALKRGRI